MLDFTSALYLGLNHDSWSLRPWPRLTTGVPAALRPTPGAPEVARRLAHLVGCQAATLGPSTLHLFWDLFAILARDRVAIYADAGLYPIARWGIERAAAQGVPVTVFRHHDPAALSRLLGRPTLRGCRPLVVTDGLCPGCGGGAPVSAYLELARRHGGRLVLDDTQSLGLLGHSPGSAAPYGRGGGGSLRRVGVKGPDVVVVNSLAKGFGTPIAMLAGSAKLVARFTQASETRVHCSPPSIPAVRAAARALTINRRHGDALRLRLARRVHSFRHRLADLGLSSTGGLHPVQTLAGMPRIPATRLHQQLLGQGIRAALHGSRHRGEPRISFIITAAHTQTDLQRAAAALHQAVTTRQTRAVGKRTRRRRASA